MIPHFLRPEVVPVSHVEIVIEDAQRAARFHAFLLKPSTGRLLDAMIADNAAADARILAEREDSVRDDGDGSACGAACGYCGRCS